VLTWQIEFEKAVPAAWFPRTAPLSAEEGVSRGARVNDGTGGAAGHTESTPISGDAAGEALVDAATLQKLTALRTGWKALRADAWLRLPQLAPVGELARRAEQRVEELVKRSASTENAITKPVDGRDVSRWGGVAELRWLGDSLRFVEHQCFLARQLVAFQARHRELMEPVLAGKNVPYHELESAALELLVPFAAGTPILTPLCFSSGDLVDPTAPEFERRWSECASRSIESALLLGWCAERTPLFVNQRERLMSAALLQDLGWMYCAQYSRRTARRTAGEMSPRGPGVIQRGEGRTLRTDRASESPIPRPRSTASGFSRGGPLEHGRPSQRTVASFQDDIGDPLFERLPQFSLPTNGRSPPGIRFQGDMSCEPSEKIDFARHYAEWSAALAGGYRGCPFEVISWIRQHHSTLETDRANQRPRLTDFDRFRPEAMLLALAVRYVELRHALALAEPYANKTFESRLKAELEAGHRLLLRAARGQASLPQTVRFLEVMGLTVRPIERHSLDDFGVSEERRWLESMAGEIRRVDPPETELHGPHWEQASFRDFENSRHRDAGKETSP